MDVTNESVRVVRDLMFSHRRAHDAVFDSVGMREVGQPMLLAILACKSRSGERCTQKELCKMLRVSPSTLTISIKSLEKRGYVRKTTDEQDLRRNYIEITQEGLEISGKCKSCIIDIDEAMFSGFTAEEKDLALDFMKRMTENLRSTFGKDSEKNV